MEGELEEDETWEDAMKEARNRMIALVNTYSSQTIYHEPPLAGIKPSSGDIKYFTPSQLVGATGKTKDAH
jgi:hypothetical protein